MGFILEKGLIKLDWAIIRHWRADDMEGREGQKIRGTVMDLTHFNSTFVLYLGIDTWNVQNRNVRRYPVQ